MSSGFGDDADYAVYSKYVHTTVTASHDKFVLYEWSYHVLGVIVSKCSS
jgi:hypothetical protein